MLILLSDYGMVSHCAWLDNEKIIGYLRGPDKRDNFLVIDVGTSAFER